MEPLVKMLDKSRLKNSLIDLTPQGGKAIIGSVIKRLNEMGYLLDGKSDIEPKDYIRILSNEEFTFSDGQGNDTGRIRYNCYDFLNLTDHKNFYDLWEYKETEGLDLEKMQALGRIGWELCSGLGSLTMFGKMYWKRKILK